MVSVWLHRSAVRIGAGIKLEVGLSNHEPPAQRARRRSRTVRCGASCCGHERDISLERTGATVQTNTRRTLCVRLACATRSCVAHGCFRGTVVHPGAALQAATAYAELQVGCLAVARARHVRVASLTARTRNAIRRGGIALRCVAACLGNALVTTADEARAAPRPNRNLRRCTVSFGRTAQVRIRLRASKQRKQEHQPPRHGRQYRTFVAPRTRGDPHGPRIGRAAVRFRSFARPLFAGFGGYGCVTRPLVITTRPA